MNWLTEVFAEQSIAWLLIYTFVAIISGFVSSLLVYRYIKRQEIIDMVLADIEKKRTDLALETEKKRGERIRKEVIRWSNPIIGAVKDLDDRLENILDKNGHLSLSRNYQEMVNSDWSVTYDYFMNSTLYLFGQYFAWIRMLQEELNFELFQSQQEKDEFFKAIRKVGSSLKSFPPPYECLGKDTQVFGIQQRAIGELMIFREKEHKRCISYPEFLHRLKDPEFYHHMEPLLFLLEDLNPQEDCRWKRLKATREALKELKKCCEDLLLLTNLKTE